jgi:hypothetical protein
MKINPSGKKTSVINFPRAGKELRRSVGINLNAHP